MYDELVRCLRHCVDAPEHRGCAANCKYGKEHPLNYSCISAMMQEAADAIEELVRREKFHAFLWNTIQPNEMEQYLAMYRAQAVPSEPPKEE